LWIIYSRKNHGNTLKNWQIELIFGANYTQKFSPSLPISHEGNCLSCLSRQIFHLLTKDLHLHVVSETDRLCHKPNFCFRKFRMQVFWDKICGLNHCTQVQRVEASNDWSSENTKKASSLFVSSFIYIKPWWREGGVGQCDKKRQKISKNKADGGCLPLKNLLDIIKIGSKCLLPLTDWNALKLNRYCLIGWGFMERLWILRYEGFVHQGIGHVPRPLKYNNGLHSDYHGVFIFCFSIRRVNKAKGKLSLKIQFTPQG